MNEIPGSWSQITCGKSQLYFIALSLIICSVNVHSKVLNTIKSKGPIAGRSVTPQQLKLNKYTGTGPNHNFICIHKTCGLSDLNKLECDAVNHKFAHMNTILNCVHNQNWLCKWK